MALDCIPRSLARLFDRYGRFVGRHPLPFLLIPICITVALAIGIITLETTSDAEYLYAPYNGRSKDERKYFRNAFVNDDDGYFSAARILDIAGFVNIHIEPKRGGNILTDDSINAVREIHEFVLDFKQKYKGNRDDYMDVCSTWNGDCSYPGILEILENVTDVSSVDITYPFHFIPGGRTVNLIQELGKVDVDSSTGVIQSARSIRLGYFARWRTSKDEKRTTAWLDGLRDELLDLKVGGVDIEFQTSLSLEQELEDSVSSIIPLFVIAYNVLAFFAVGSCLMSDWVRAKPWVAMSGLVAAAFGIASSLGLTSACGVKFASVVGTMPFLVIGIGVDDMFILVAAWRYTSYKKSVEERMGETLSHAAISITITSITDALAFGIGCLTPFRSITIFCAYTGVAIVFVYFYMITFTAACLVYSGRREEANKHPMTCRKVLPKSEAGHKSTLYRLFCTGGSSISASSTKNSVESAEDTDFRSKKEPLPPISPSSHAEYDDVTAHRTNENEGIHLPWMNAFLEDYYAPFLLKIPTKIGVIVVYCVMIGFAIYGIVNLEEGLDRANLAPDGSYYRDYYKKEVRDFTDNYGPAVQVGFNERLDYTEQSVRDKIDDTIMKFRKTKYFVNDENFVTSWLKDFEAFLDSNGTDINTLTMTEFITILRDEFFVLPQYQFFYLDVSFNSDHTAITDSRILLQSRELSDANDELNMMKDARDVADDAHYKVEVFAPAFIFFDQYLVIAINTIQNLGIAIASMALVALLLIPSLTTVVWVTIATLSICACVVGFMSLWDVTLDSVSMINLIMCIGFSVDFAAHISYHYVITQADSPNERARQAIGYLGLAIIQGFLSTVLAVLALASSDTYIFRTFFKLVFLVMVFGFFHAMFLLPVLLSTLNFDKCKKKKTDSKDIAHSNGVTSQSANQSAVELGMDNVAYNK